MDGFENYLKYRKRYSEHTIKAYLEDVYEWMLFTKNLSPGQKEARKYIAFNAERGYSPTTIRRKVASISRYYRFSGEVNPFDGLPMPRMSQKLPEVIPEQIFHEIVDFPEDDFTMLRNKAIIILLYGTGIRVSEMINITHSDITDTDILIRAGKGNRDRLQPYGEPVVSILKRYIAAKHDAGWGTAPADPLFISAESGTNMSQRRVYHVCIRMTGGSPHAIRHSYATHMLGQGAHISAIKELMGHKSIASTQRYIHLDINTLQEQHNKLFK